MNEYLLSLYHVTHTVLEMQPRMKEDPSSDGTDPLILEKSVEVWEGDKQCSEFAF